jgi:hypothetical protein
VGGEPFFIPPIRKKGKEFATSWHKARTRDSLMEAVHRAHNPAKSLKQTSLFTAPDLLFVKWHGRGVAFGQGAKYEHPC